MHTLPVVYGILVSVKIFDPGGCHEKNIVVQLTNEHIILRGGLAVVGAILGKSDFVKNCNRMKVNCNHQQHQIKNGDVMLTYIGMQCMGKPGFDAFMKWMTTLISIRMRSASAMRSLLLKPSASVLTWPAVPSVSRSLTKT